MKTQTQEHFSQLYGRTLGSKSSMPVIQLALDTYIERHGLTDEYTIVPYKEVYLDEYGLPHVEKLIHFKDGFSIIIRATKTAMWDFYILEAPSLEDQKVSLTETRDAIQKELASVEQRLDRIDLLQRPYVCEVVAYSGRFSSRSATEDKGRQKYRENRQKDYYKNGLTYAVRLLHYKPDGTTEVLEQWTRNGYERYAI